MSPAAVLFDVGGTLLEERSYHLRPGLESLLANASIPTKSGPDAVFALTADLAERIDHVHATNDAEFVFADWLRAQLAPGAGADLQRLEEEVFGSIADLVPMPGAREAVAELARRRIPMAAVSNAIFTGPTLRSELQRHGLAEDLAFVLSSADLGIRKPAAGIFREALRRLGGSGSDATRVWFVGDSLENDVAGASRLGMRALWLSPRDRSEGDSPPHRRIRDWREFCALLP